MNKVTFYKTPKAKYTYYIETENHVYKAFNTQGLFRNESRMLVNDSYPTKYEYPRITDFITPVNHVAERAVEVAAETIPYRVKRSFIYYTSVADNRRYKFKHFQDKKFLTVK